jgi:hypothetical protein
MSIGKIIRMVSVVFMYFTCMSWGKVIDAYVLYTGQYVIRFVSAVKIKHQFKVGIGMLFTVGGLPSGTFMIMSNFCVSVTSATFCTNCNEVVYCWWSLKVPLICHLCLSLIWEKKLIIPEYENFQYFRWVTIVSKQENALVCSVLGESAASWTSPWYSIHMKELVQLWSSSCIANNECTMDGTS